MTKDGSASQQNKKVIIIGGGPAGLTAAYQLSKAAVSSVVLEKDPVLGGLSRTVEYKGYHFDIGGHRFFTKVKAVDDIWREILSNNEFLRCSRLSRIYYNKRFFQYPLRAFDALFKLGLQDTTLISISYLRARLFPFRNVETFEQWITNSFGRRLYRMFFKTYTEKVWGIPCNEISAEWAAQRIQELTLSNAIKNAFSRRRKKDKTATIKTLIEEFDYPIKGPGMMWEKMARIASENCSTIRLDTSVECIRWKDNAVFEVEVVIGGHQERIAGSHFISSMPVRELIQKLSPPAPVKVTEAANNLKYRDFITVALIINKANLFPDNWIYVHDHDVKLGRIQNFKNWSSSMVPDKMKTCLGLEYFCFEGDGLWNMTNQELINLGKQELQKLDLVKESDIEDGFVVKMPKAYPVYNSGYKESLKIIRGFLKQLKNLHLVGRNGLHKYNNQDHSMLTAMLAVENIQGANYNLWAVNTDQEYHENGVAHDAKSTVDYSTLASTQPKVPKRI